MPIAITGSPFSTVALKFSNVTFPIGWRAVLLKRSDLPLDTSKFLKVMSDIQRTRIPSSTRICAALLP